MYQHSDNSPPRQDAPTITRGYITTPFGQVHYRAAGSRRADQTPLVLLHQTASSSVMFEGVMRELAPFFWCFAPDTPGFGGTKALPETGSIARYAEVIRSALRHAGIDPCFLFGHHSGASIAVQIAHDEPTRVKKLALSGPPYLTKADIERLVPSVCPVSIDPEGEHLLAVWRRIRAKDPAAPLDLSHREAVLNLLAGVRYPEAYNAVFDHDLAGQLRTLDHETLVMIGPEDTIRASAEPAARALRHGRLHVFASGGTYICDREPSLVASALRDFFLSDPVQPRRPANDESERGTP
jgi:haloalkane dehalogenase